jgi:hypothetical protein
LETGIKRPEASKPAKTQVTGYELGHSRQRTFRGPAVVFSLLMFIGYILSYYGWVRSTGARSYSLKYDQISWKGVSSMLERVHWPLQRIDAQFRVRLYDTRGPFNVPDFDEPPDFDVPNRSEIQPGTRPPVRADP